MSVTLAPQTLAPYIRTVIAGGDLSEREAFDAVASIMQAQATQAQVAALLAGLALKGETADELAGAAAALREQCVRLSSERTPLLDVCGTGGDSAGTFNISTATAFVVAGAGIAVAKHGNRAMSSRCGSADVLEALGLNLWMAPNRAAAALDEIGIAFLFAQHYHPALRHIAGVRREIGVRTLFNLIGPLANPARPTHQIVGIGNAHLLPATAAALRHLGLARGAVLHARDGLDEVSLSAPTDVIEWDGRGERTYTIDPQELGFARGDARDVAGADAAANALTLLEVLNGTPGTPRDIVVLNAALALHLCDRAGSLPEAMTLAQTAIDSGAAFAKLEALIRASNE
ncbi:MAG: anthranilate phosphoribosyltransferase [Candidatus Eremiobacteraeota bacterium]|nr:anthranilate phosphoribosyltransferase [Candidatus Eremiobacteraeota bacterium]